MMDYTKEVYERTIRAYGKVAGLSCRWDRSRLHELRQFTAFGMDERLLILQAFAERCRADGRRYRTSVDGSFVAWLLGIARFDPLWPHTVCNKCQALSYNFDADAPLGIDLAQKSCFHCDSDLTRGGYGLTVNWELAEPMWIIVSDQYRDELRGLLAQLVDGDLVASETWADNSFILHPSQGGGRELRIYGSNVYTQMDATRRAAGEPLPPDDPAVWENGFYPGYIPGFFNETEEYELRRCGAKNMTELVAVLEEMRGISKTKALYLAADYLEAADLMRRAPAEWFGTYLNLHQGDPPSLFDYATMGQGIEICRRAKEKNREPIFFHPSRNRYCRKDSDSCRKRNDLYRACEAAYLRGVTFLPPDLAASHRTHFIPKGKCALLCPLAACTLTSESVN